MIFRRLLTIILLCQCIFIPFGNRVFSQIGEWKLATNGGIIHRHECSFVEVDGKFYLIGGRKLGVDKYTNIYNPASNTWTQGTHKSPIELQHFQAVNYNGLIYIICAFTGNFPDETPTDKIYIYNPADDTWTIGATIPEARRRGSAGVVVYNNQIYIAGGATQGHEGGNVAWLDRYNPATDVWEILPDAPHARDHFQAAISGNKLFLAGGRRTSLSTGHLNDLVVKEVDAYDFTSNTWETYPNLIPTGRAGTATAILNGELIVIGGEGPASPSLAHKNTEAMDLDTKTWRSLALLDTGRHATHAIVFNDKIYIVAGSKSKGGSSSSELSSMEVFSFEAPLSNDLSIPSEIDFGQVVTEQRNSKTLMMINNAGNNDITINTISIINNTGDNFIIPTPPDLPHVINAGSSFSVDIVFTPIATGMKSAAIVVNHTGINSPDTVNLRGECVAQISAIKNKSEFSNVIIYPNPGKDKITINNIPNEVYWEIYNSHGIKIKTGSGGLLGAQVLDITELETGVYILTLIEKNNNSRSSFRFSKE